MKTVFLTSGPRGSGKTEYIKKAASLYPEIEVISRDAILIELFSSTSLNPYEGGHCIAMEVFYERIEKFLANNRSCNLIIDCWNGFSEERVSMVRDLRDLGADRVICWQFMIPADICVRWFFSKPDSKGYSEDGIRDDHKLYYDMAENIKEDGFDEIYHINPCQLILNL